MEKEFVPYELAVKLKPLDYDEECFGYYHVTDGYTKGYAFCYFDKPKRFKDGFDVLAPTFSQAFRWFREKYGLYSHVRESYSFDNTLEFVSQINGNYVNHGIFDKPINRFDTYEEAELACLTNLIEIVKTRTK